jgi:hypothetical protein
MPLVEVEPEVALMSLPGGSGCGLRTHEAAPQSPKRKHATAIEDRRVRRIRGGD